MVTTRRAAIVVTIWIEVLECDAIGADATKEMIVHQFLVIANEPGQVTRVAHAIDRICRQHRVIVIIIIKSEFQ